MNEFLQKLVDLKVPSLIIFGGFIWLTSRLLGSSPAINSSTGIAGLISLSITILLGVYAFLEHLIKEHYESIIKTQQEAMKHTNLTLSTFESYRQKRLTVASDKLSQDEYTDIAEKSETDT